MKTIKTGLKAKIKYDNVCLYKNTGEEVIISFDEARHWHSLLERILNYAVKNKIKFSNLFGEGIVLNKKYDRTI